MNNVKFLLSIFIGIFAYVIISIFAGPDGIWAYKQLNNQKNILSTNVEKIQKINDTLTLDYKALEDDVGFISSRARSLGFIYEGEKLVKIQGISDNEMSVYDTGSFVVLEDISYVSEKLCKILGVLCFGLSFSILGLIDLKSKNRVNSIMVATTVFNDCKD